MELKEILSLFSKETARLARAQSYLKKEISWLREKLNASNKTIDSLFTHFADGLLYINDETHIEFCNKAASDILSLSKEQLVGKNYADLFSDSFFGFSMIEIIKEKRGVLRLFCNLDTKEPKSVEIMANPIVANPGSTLGGVLLLIKDNTAVKGTDTSAQPQPEYSTTLKVVGSLAHEIRNPLMAIDGFATLLAFELKEKGSRDKARSILEGTKLINRVIEDALAYCETPKIKLTLTDLDPLIREVIRHFEVASQEKERVQFQVKGVSLVALADQELLKLALFNLLKNGLEAAPKGTSLQVELKRESKYVLIAVKDSGPGMDSNTLDKLFTPRFTTKTSGHGLGLAQTYKAITSQGGKLAVESLSGVGSTFIIKLPIYHAP